MLFWMGLIFWFSHQPANESVNVSLRVMRLAGSVLDHWQFIGIIAFILLFIIFLIWLTRRSTPLWGKCVFFLLFLACCISVIYVLLYIVRPRFGISNLTSMNYWTLHLWLRKYAHFFIYLFLGIVVKNALSVSGKRGIKAFFIALMICSLYAVTDEIHQMFIPGRTALVMDVVIDTAGAAVGILLYSFIDWLSGSRTIWQAFWNS